MIKVEMMQTDKGYSVAASGHADYAPKGQDIVCAAASVLLQTLANKVEEAARQKQLESSCVQHGESFVVQAKPSGGMTGIMVAAWYDFVEEGLSELAGQYPDHVELYIYDDSDGCDAPEKALNLQKFAEGGDGGAGAANRTGGGTFQPGADRHGGVYGAAGRGFWLGVRAFSGAGAAMASFSLMERYFSYPHGKSRICPFSSSQIRVANLFTK